MRPTGTPRYLSRPLLPDKFIILKPLILKVSDSDSEHLELVDGRERSEGLILLNAPPPFVSS